MVQANVGQRVTKLAYLFLGTLYKILDRYPWRELIHTNKEYHFAHVEPQNTILGWGKIP